MSENNLPSILIIDDDPIYRRLSGSILKERFNVFTAEAPSLGFQVLKCNTIDFVICDYQLPEMNGLDVLERIKTEYPNIEVIMISDRGDMDTVINALRRGAADYFKKPFTPADIWMSIEKTIKYAEIKKKYNVEKTKNVQLKKQVDKEFGFKIIGNSQAINDVKLQMKLVADTPDTSVLILGESGTGKELVARGIHNLSNRKDEIFGAVNMSAIPENLFESEFFGHKKGSFTGAVADRTGWFETCNNGTLFLDEIGEMPQNLQVKLLRVLENRTFTKIGTQNEQKFNIRIVSATNKGLDEISNGKNFRLDLLHRVGTFIIHLPPLRDRKTDIPDLVNYFVSFFSEKMAKNIRSIEPAVIEKLVNYSFPGNIRELRNVIERSIILCTDNILKLKHFSILDSFANARKEFITETFNLEEIEKQTILNALEKTNFNKAEAARLLNLEWNALHRRLLKFKIDI